MSAGPGSQDRALSDLSEHRCPRGHRMRLKRVRIESRRVARAGGMGGWHRDISYDQWVCDFCGHREPPQPIA